MRYSTIAIVLLIFSFPAQSSAPLSVTTLLHRGKSHKKTALLVLFPGGYGELTLSGETKLNNSFLVRIHSRFSADFDTLTIGPRHNSPNGYSDSERVSKLHATDVIAALKRVNKKKLPIILIGTSRGTLSATFLAKKVNASGIVLTTTLSARLRRFNLTNITHPTLIVHNKQDSCRYTPFDEAKQLAAELPNAQFVKIEGGRKPGPDTCSGKHYHGFWGSERKIIPAMEKWIRKLIKKKKQEID